MTRRRDENGVGPCAICGGPETPHLEQPAIFDHQFEEAKPAGGRAVYGGRRAGRVVHGAKTRYFRRAAATLEIVTLPFKAGKKVKGKMKGKIVKP